MTTPNQDQWHANEWEKRVLARMGLDEWKARKLIEESDFEFRYVDPDVHPRSFDGVKRGDDGLIFGSKRTHEKLFDWFHREIARVEALLLPQDPVATAVVAEPLPAPSAKPLDGSSDSKGRLAYEARLNGMAWAEVDTLLGVPKALNNARAYARSHDLAWPPALS